MPIMHPVSIHSNSSRTESHSINIYFVCLCRTLCFQKKMANKSTNLYIYIFRFGVESLANYLQRLVSVRLTIFEVRILFFLFRATPSNIKYIWSVLLWSIWFSKFVPCYILECLDFQNIFLKSVLRSNNYFAIFEKYFKNLFWDIQVFIMRFSEILQNMICSVYLKYLYHAILKLWKLFVWTLREI